MGDRVAGRGRQTTFIWLVGSALTDLRPVSAFATICYPGVGTHLRSPSNVTRRLARVIPQTRSGSKIATVPDYLVSLGAQLSW
jgi:hypothetical protein